MSEQPGETIDADVPEPDDIADALESGSAEPSADVSSASDEMVNAGSDALESAAEPSETSSTSLIGDLLEGATRTPEKSLHDIDKSEYFDPETGGTNRLVLVFDDIATHGDGLKNWQHAIIGVVEIAVSDGLDVLPQGSEPEESDTDGSDDESPDLSGLEIAGGGE